MVAYEEAMRPPAPTRPVVRGARRQQVVHAARGRAIAIETLESLNLKVPACRITTSGAEPRPRRLRFKSK
jgi:hypothetical protein